MSRFAKPVLTVCIIAVLYIIGAVTGPLTASAQTPEVTNTVTTRLVASTTTPIPSGTGYFTNFTPIYYISDLAEGPLPLPLPRLPAPLLRPPP
jgi:hypothetical protein